VFASAENRDPRADASGADAAGRLPFAAEHRSAVAEAVAFCASGLLC